VTPLVATLAIWVTFPNRAAADDWDRPGLGFYAISIAENADALTKFGKMPTRAGLLVLDVAPGSSAAAAGLKTLDVIATINRQPVGTMDDALDIVESLKIGDPLLLRGWGLNAKNVWQKGDVKTKVISVRDTLMGCVKSSKDDVNGYTYYRHVLAPKPVTETSIDAFVRVVETKPQLWLRVMTRSSRWLMFESLLVVDGEKRGSIKLTHGDVDIEASGGITTEREDVLIDKPDDLAVLTLFATGSRSKARIDGSERYIDVDADLQMRGRMATMLGVYKLLSAQE
jgi:hypothetical protein